MLRHLITALLLVALLPWGAYTAALSAQRNGVRNEFQNETSAQVAASQKTMMAAPRKCRLPGLASFGCAADPAHPMTLGADHDPRGPSHVPPHGDWSGEDVPHAPPKGPPRFL